VGDLSSEPTTAQPAQLPKSSKRIAHDLNTHASVPCTFVPADPFGAWCLVDTASCPSAARAHGLYDSPVDFDYCQAVTQQGCFCSNTWSFGGVTYNGTCRTGGLFTLVATGAVSTVPRARCTPAHLGSAQAHGSRKVSAVLSCRRLVLFVGRSQPQLSWRFSPAVPLAVTAVTQRRVPRGPCRPARRPLEPPD
jgi:hypothetical protein